MQAIARQTEIQPWISLTGHSFREFADEVILQHHKTAKPLSVCASRLINIWLRDSLWPHIADLYPRWQRKLHHLGYEKDAFLSEFCLQILTKSGKGGACSPADHARWKAFVRRTAENIFLTLVRTRKRADRRMPVEAVGEAIDGFPTTEHADPSLMIDARAAVESLPSGQREAVKRRLNGAPPEAIAQARGRTVGAARRSTDRGIETALKKIAEDACPDAAVAPEPNYDVQPRPNVGVRKP